MKKQLTKAISKKVFTLLFVVIVSFGMSQTAYALEDSSLKKGAQITYKGFYDKKLVFNVDYKNELSQAFELTIKNDQDEIIYTQHFDAKPFNKTLFFTEVPESCKLTFSIRMGKKEMSQAFEINTQVKTVEEYLVKGM